MADEPKRRFYNQDVKDSGRTRIPLTLPVIGIFDIGKTNKKFLLFDDRFNVVHKTEVTLPVSEDDDGFPCEDLPKLTAWIRQCVNEVSDNRRYRLFALNYSAYGASFVHVDNEGNPATPLYSYFKPFPEKLLADFYKTYGGKSDFTVATASPPMGMLNSGLQLYWLKHAKPDMYRRISCSMHLPQYISYLFTGKAYSEPTSIGCHTGLWDFRTGQYHDWVEKEDIDRLLPDIMAPSARLRILYRQHALDSGIGIHDSSASLAPFLLLLDEPFLLVSTGTWSITLNPFSNSPLTYDELERDCLQYIDIRGNQVKASRFLLGGEYEFQLEKLKRHFNRDDPDKQVKANNYILKKILSSNDQKGALVLEKSGDSGPYPRQDGKIWDINRFGDYEEGIHRLLLDLAYIQSQSVKLAADKTDFRKIIVTGGFSKNNLFMQMLASMFPDKELCTTQLSDATALGAALVINQNDVNKQRLQTIDWLGLKTVKPLEIPELRTYRWSGGRG